MKSKPDGSFIWSIVLGVLVFGMVITAHGFPETLRFAPLIAGYGTLAMIGILILGQFYPEILRWTETTLQDLWGGGAGETPGGAEQQADKDPSWSAVVRAISYAVVFLALVILIGLPVVIPIFITTYLVVEAQVKFKWAVLSAAIVSTGLIVGMVLLQVTVWAGIAPEIIPDYIGGSIFPPL